MNCAQFVSALLMAVGGENLTLSSGQVCGQIDLRNWYPASTVRVRAHGATVVGLRMQDGANLHWTGGTFHAPGGKEGNSPTDHAVRIRGFDNVGFYNVSFTNAGRGLVASGGTNLVARNNRFHGLRVDGINLVSMDGALVEGNSFRSFSPRRTQCLVKTKILYGKSERDCLARGGAWTDGDHPDGVQMFGDPIANIRIVGNTIDGNMQSAGIFSNEGTWPNARQENVAISYNYIRSPRSWGISLQGCRDCEVIGNDVGRTTNGTAKVQINVIGSTGIFCGNSNPDAPVGHITVQPCP